MTATKISCDHMARVEGHGSIHVVIEDGQVQDVRMSVIEPARMFEAMVKGRSYLDSTYICSRICGICSENHVITDLKAIEQIFGIRVSRRTQLLRQLMVYGSYLQNHASHLFVFAVPDYLGHRSMFPLADTNPELLDKALRVKWLGNELCNRVAGRSIHPITAVVGGFTHEMSSAEYLEMADMMDEILPFAKEVVDLFNSFPVPDIAVKGEMLAMVEEGEYPIQSSDILKFLGSGDTFTALQRDDFIREYAVDHSAAFCSRTVKGDKPYFTGALARINASWDNLTSDAKLAADKVGLRPPVLNPFKNNVAQAVELVDALVRCSEICRELAEGEWTSVPEPFKVCAGHGIGVTEAPRGIVFHEVTLDDDGKVVNANIMTPTCQNMANLEVDARTTVDYLLEKGTPEDVIRLQVEKLVRAYDPCFSCSVH